MFILSYFRKKQTIALKQHTLENIDDDFIVIQKDNEETSNASGSASRVNAKSINDSFSASKLDLWRDEENDKSSFLASGLRPDENKKEESIIDINEENDTKNVDTFVSEDKQLIENIKDVHCTKLSICNKITLLAKMLLKKLAVVLYKNNNI